jgi:DNA invertase Pin-like site-specific DNA recombinase
MAQAFSYVRFSNAQQAQGNSYERQTDKARRYAEAHGLTLATAAEHQFFDQGKSAYKAKHLDDEGQLRRFLSLVEDGSIEPGSFLLIESLDRLSREKVRDALPRFLDLLQRGIKIVTLSDNRVYDQDYNDIDLIVSIISMSRAHEESAMKSQRLKAVWDSKHKAAISSKKPIGGNCPAWLEYKDGEYEIIEEKAEIVRRIYSLCIQGYGYTNIIKLLNQEGIPLLDDSNRNKAGAWGVSGIWRILSNKATIGTFLFKGDEIPNYFPTVIDEGTFYEARAAIEQRKRTASSNPGKGMNVWQKIAYCTSCKAPMHFVRKRENNEYLRCSAYAKGNCTQQPISTKSTELVFKELLPKLDSLSLVQTNTNALTKELTINRGKQGEIKARIEAIQAQMMDISTALPPTVLKMLTALDTELQTYAQREDEIVNSLSMEKLIDKDEFFKRLDLVSFAGRSKANSLLKSLNIKVFMSRNKMFVQYDVERDTFPVLSVFEHKGELIWWGKDEITKNVAEAQGDGAVESLVRTMMKVTGLDEESVVEMTQQFIDQKLTNNRR